MKKKKEDFTQIFSEKEYYRVKELSALFEKHKLVLNYYFPSLDVEELSKQVSEILSKDLVETSDILNAMDDVMKRNSRFKVDCLPSYYMVKPPTEDGTSSTLGVLQPEPLCGIWGPNPTPSIIEGPAIDGEKSEWIPNSVISPVVSRGPEVPNEAIPIDFDFMNLDPTKANLIRIDFRPMAIPPNTSDSYLLDMIAAIKECFGDN